METLLGAGANPLQRTAEDDVIADLVGGPQSEEKKRIIDTAVKAAITKDPAAGKEYQDCIDARLPIDMLINRHNHTPDAMAAAFPAAAQNPFVAAEASSLISNCSFESLPGLLKFGVDVNARNRDGIPPLLAAIEREDYARASFLLNHGARGDVKDRYGDTLGDYISRGEKIALIGLLADKGVDLNIPAKDGRTAQQIAEANGQRAKAEMIGALSSLAGNKAPAQTTLPSAAALPSIASPPLPAPKR